MTATDLIMAVMEEFSTAEAKSMVVVWTDEGGEVCLASNCSDLEAIGMSEYLKARALKRMISQVKEP